MSILRAKKEAINQLVPTPIMLPQTIIHPEILHYMWFKTKLSRVLESALAKRKVLAEGPADNFCNYCKVVITESFI